MSEAVLSSLADAAEALSCSGLFAALGRDLADDILRQGAQVQLEPGSVLFRQGDPGDCAYVVLDGELDVLVGVGGQQVRMAELGRNQLVGEIAVFAREPRTATVVARRACRLLRLDGALVIDIISRNSAAGVAVIADLGRRLAMGNQPLAFLSMAARALSLDNFDSRALAGLTRQAGELGPFARSFQEMVEAIQARQAHRQEMALAARIQQSLLPRAFDETDKPFGISAFMRPMHEVGGDLYDFFLIDDRTLAFVVADVSGKGVPASLFMVMFRTIVKSMAVPGMRLEQVMERLNTLLVADNQACMFVTVFFGVLDLESGQLDYVSAGHNPPYVLSASRGRQALPSTAIPVGIMPTAVYQPESVTLLPGERLFLFTDGVTEACSAERQHFGEERLEALLDDLVEASPDDLVRKVVAAVDAFAEGAEQFDDITCLSLVWNPKSAVATSP